MGIYTEDIRLAISVSHTSIAAGYGLTENQILDQLNPAINLHMFGHIDQAKHLISQSSTIVQTAFDNWVKDFDGLKREADELANTITL